MIREKRKGKPSGKGKGGKKPKGQKEPVKVGK